MGTEIYLLTPNISRLAATPANSLTVFARLTNNNKPNTNAVMRKPRLSRIRSARPLPVTTPRRALISWIMISAMTTRGIIHNKE